jgi:hypothetical protein
VPLPSTFAAAPATVTLAPLGTTATFLDVDVGEDGSVIVVSQQNAADPKNGDVRRTGTGAIACAKGTMSPTGAVGIVGGDDHPHGGGLGDRRSLGRDRGRRRHVGDGRRRHLCDRPRDGLGDRLTKVEQALTALAGTGLTTEGVLGAVERLEGSRAKGPQAKKRRGADEDDGLTALNALVVAGLRALVMLVPELPVTSTVAAKILGIQRVKLDGGGVKTTALGRALVAPFGQWLARAFQLVPPPPGLALLVRVAEVATGAGTPRGRGRRRERAVGAW